MQVQKISETIQKFDGISYYRCGPYFQRKGVRLHRKVWEMHNGPIPPDCDVHHIDGNKANNDIENLQLLPRTEHHSKHMGEPKRKEQSRQGIKKAIDAAREWHGTADGFDFHSRHAKAYWEKAEMRTYTCTCCGKQFQSRSVYGSGINTFCSNNCKSAWRRRHGIDNVTRQCPVCGKSFAANKYSKTVCCSSECARVKRWGK
jgi:hypothetical protein